MQIGDYAIKPTSDSAEKELIEFIKFNGFKHVFKFENSYTDDNKLLIINLLDLEYYIIPMVINIGKEYLILKEYFKEKNIIQMVN